MKKQSLGWILFFVALFIHPIGATNESIPYQVQSGDTIWTFSNLYLKGVDAWKEVVKINKVSEPKALQPDTVLKIPTHLIRLLPEQARCENVFGKPTLKTVKGSLRLIESGDFVGVGDHIQTARDQSLTLRLSDGSLIRVEPDTSLLVGQLGRSMFRKLNFTDFEVLKGKIQATVTTQKGGDRFVIRNQTALAGVRGTEFSFASFHNRAILEVHDGKVAYLALHGNASEKLLSTGEVGLIDENGSILVGRTRPAPELKAKSTIQVADQVYLDFTGRDVPSGGQFKVYLDKSPNFQSPFQLFPTSVNSVELGDLPTSIYWVRLSTLSPDGTESEPVEVQIDRIQPPPGRSVAVYKVDSKTRSVRFDWPVLGQANRFVWSQFENRGSDLPVVQINVDQPSLTQCCFSEGEIHWRIDQFQDDLLLHKGVVHTSIIGPELALPKSKALNSQP